MLLTDTLPPLTPEPKAPTSKVPVVAELLIFPVSMNCREATPMVVPLMPVVFMFSALLAELPMAAADNVFVLLVTLPRVKPAKLFSTTPSTVAVITAVAAAAPTIFC